MRARRGEDVVIDAVREDHGDTAAMGIPAGEAGR